MIPLNFHFCSFFAPPERGGKPFSYVHYLCLASVIKHHPGAVFNFYYDQPISSPWFAQIQDHLALHRVEPPKSIFGLPLKRIEHRADIFRLRRLIETGGIYLDTDVFVCQSFAPLCSLRMVMGQEERQGLCNAVMLAEPESPFLKAWLEAYNPASEREGAGFKPDGWAEMSVRFPEILARDFPETITILPKEAFFDPMGDGPGLVNLFESAHYDQPLPYAQHLWASQAWSRWIGQMEPQTVLRGQGYFYRLARRVMTEREILGAFN